MQELKVKVVYPNLTLAQCYALHCSEHYQNEIAAAADTTRRGIDYTPLGRGGLRRKARFEYTRRVEGHRLQLAARAAMPRLGHDEYSTYVGPEGGTWKIEGGLLGIAPRCVRGEGTLVFKQRGCNVHRTVRGTIHCSIPMLGSVIEAQVIRRTGESLKQAAAYTPEYVRRYPAAVSPSWTLQDLSAEACALGATVGGSAPLP